MFKQIFLIARLILYTFSRKSLVIVVLSHYIIFAAQIFIVIESHELFVGILILCS
jgi:hypothetical protein